MNIVSADKLIKKLDVNVYPITLIKFLLNRGKILSYFSMASRLDFEFKGKKYLTSIEDCEECAKRKSIGLACRQHTSLFRVLEAKKVLYDLDTMTFFFKNEIFKMVNNRLVIVYCPHTKLIVGKISDEKVRKIRPMTIEDPKLTILPDYERVEIVMSELMDQYTECWFNDEFSIRTIPNDRRTSDWCLVANN